MSRKKNKLNPDQPESKDQIINDLIQKRKLQQEALLKIMTSMDKSQEATSPSDKSSRKRNLAEKIFSTDKKPKNK